MSSLQSPTAGESVASSGGGKNVWLIDDAPTIDPRSPVFYFDFKPVLDRRETLRRNPEMVWLMCQNHVQAAAPGELTLPREDGFFLVVQTCSGAAAEIIASRANLVLLRLFFGTDCLNKLAALFRTAAYTDLVEAGIAHVLSATSASPSPDTEAEGTAKSNAPTHSRQSQLPGCIDLTPGFLPMMNLRCGMPAIYLCGAVGTRGGQIVFGSATLRNCDPQRRTAIDLAILEHCLGFARMTLPTRFAAAIAASVSYETLAWSRGRRAYQDALRSAGAAASPFLIVKIDDVPPGTLGSRLAEITAMVRPFARRVFVQLPDCDNSLIQNGHIGAAGLCLTLPTGATPSAIGRFTAWLSKAAAVQHALACMDGVDRPDALPLLCAGGIRYAANRAGNQNIPLGELVPNRQGNPMAQAA